MNARCDTGYRWPVTVTLAAPHDHSWRLHAVILEDGAAVEEFGCDCGAVEFR